MQRRFVQPYCIFFRRTSSETAVSAHGDQTGTIREFPLRGTLYHFFSPPTYVCRRKRRPPCSLPSTRSAANALNDHLLCDALPAALRAERPSAGRVVDGYHRQRQRPGQPGAHRPRRAAPVAHRALTPTLTSALPASCSTQVGERCSPCREVTRAKLHQLTASASGLPASVQSTVRMLGLYHRRGDVLFYFLRL